MRPAYRIAIAAAVLLVGVIAVLVTAGTAEPPRPRPSPALTEPLTAREGEDRIPSAEQREALLDELQDREATEIGPAEAARRRNYREQLLKQRPAPSTAE